ncbi:hypothetical protein [Megasphaera stantonii]|nr:hypothetical protein [Megasphaera stantonii]
MQLIVPPITDESCRRQSAAVHGAGGRNGIRAKRFCRAACAMYGKTR